MLLSPWDFPGKQTGVDCLFLLQEIFLTQGSSLSFLHCRRILYHWATREENPVIHVINTLLRFQPWLQNSNGMYFIIFILCENLFFHLFVFWSIRSHLDWKEKKWQLIPLFFLGNPVNTGACQAAVHGAAKSWTWLKWLSMSMQDCRRSPGRSGDD